VCLGGQLPWHGHMRPATGRASSFHPSPPMLPTQSGHKVCPSVPCTPGSVNPRDDVQVTQQFISTFSVGIFCHEGAGELLQGRRPQYTKSQNHRMHWVGMDLKDHPPSNPHATFHQTRLLKAPSNLALNTAREGAATASLGNPGQGLTTLTVKNFFLTSNLNLTSFSLKPLPLVLSLLVKSPSPAVLQAPSGTGRPQSGLPGGFSSPG